MFTDKDISEDPTVKDFFSSRNLKPRTQKAYIFAILKYCRYTGLTPTEFIEEAETEEDERIRMKNRKIKKHLTGFIKKLDEEGVTPGTLKKYVSSVKSFYDESEIELPKIRCRIPEKEELVTIKDIPDKNDIRKALKYANIRYKAIIHLMMSSGMGSAEIRALSLNDFINAHEIKIKEPFSISTIIEKLKEKENEIPTWSIRRVKTGMPYVTFSSPESNRAIIDYLEDRNEKEKIQSENEYLFQNYKNGRKLNKKMSINAFAKYFKDINDNAGFGRYKKQIFFRSHSLRKFFASTLKNNGMDYLDAEWLIGHKVKGVTDIYIKPDIYRLKMDYMDVLPHLSIEEIETVTIESQDVKELRMGNIELEARVKELEKEKVPDDQALIMGIIADEVKKDPKMWEKIRNRIAQEK